MSSSLPDPFESFAEQCGLRLAIDRITVAPRDVLTPLTDAEQHFLVAVSGPASADPVRLVFVAPALQAEAPTVRDVLWWLASDAWAVERGGGALAPWAATYRYPADAEATVRLFEHHVRQVRALAATLGEVAYRHLLAIYGVEITGAPIAAATIPGAGAEPSAPAGGEASTTEP